MSTPRVLPPAQLERLRRVDSPKVANAVETFGVRLRNTGFTDHHVRCVFPSFPTVAGYAATARLRTSEPPMEGHSYYDRTDWWNHIMSIPAPRIVVLEDVDRSPGFGAAVGEVHANILCAMGCLALLTNGAVRDLPAVRAIRFQMFAGNISVSHAYAHIFEFGGRVTIGGMHVEPGDLLHGDCHGMQTVPWEIADKVAERAEQMHQDERHILSLCHSTDFTIEKLRKTIKEMKK